MKYLLVLVALFSFTPYVYGAVSIEDLPDANSHGDFVVGPGKIEISLDPGQSTTVELTISNRLGVDKIFTIGEEDFTGSTDPSQTVVLLGDDKGPYSLKDYISPDATRIAIPNAKKARVPVIISIPENAEPGGLYGSLVVGTVTDAASTDGSNGAAPTNALVTRIGTLFFVRVNGPVKESGHVTKFMTAGNQKIFFDSSSILFNILYQNDGNISVNPSGNIAIDNILGSSVGLIKIDPWFAMPQSLRFREVEWKPKYLFGRYKAHAVIERGYGTDKDSMDLVFWVFPLKIILSIIVGLIIIFVGLRFVLTRFKIARK